MLFTKKIIQSGGSLCLTIPADSVSLMDLRPGDYIKVEIIKVIKK